MQQFTCHSFTEKPQFIEEMAEAAQDVWGHLRPGWGIPERIDYYQKRMNASGVEQMLVAADSKGDFAGMAGLTAYDMENRKDLFGWLADVYVKPQHRGLGLGTWLVAQVEAQAVGEGLKELYLYTPDAAEFYERTGWHVVENVTYKGEPVTIMRKDLAQAFEHTADNIVPLKREN